MQTLIERLYAPSNRTLYLAFFRVYIAFHLMKKLLFQWSSLDTLFGVDSFAVSGDTLLQQWVGLDLLYANYKLIIFVYMVLIAFFAFGIGKRWTALLLFVMVEVVQRMNGYVLNGGDNLLKFLLLYMVFADSFRYFSLSQLNFKSDTWQKITNLTTNVGVFCIMLHLALVYLVSGLHKTHADVWFNGTATYYTFSLERFMGTQYNTWFVSNGYFVTLGTYFALLWELSFAFVIWYKKIRPYFLLCGVMLHLGIYVFMMIHDFQIIFIMAYGFFFTDAQWRSLGARMLRWRPVQALAARFATPALDLRATPQPVAALHTSAPAPQPAAWTPIHDTAWRR